MTHLLVISGGRLMPPTIRRIRPDVRVSIICRNRLLPKVIDPEQAPYLISVPDDAPPATWADLAEAVHRVDPFDRVVAFSETDQDKAPVIAARLNLPGSHPAATVACVYDKALMRRTLAAAGLDETPGRIVSGPDEVYAFARQYGYPLILKPNQATASIGVSRIDGDRDVAAAFQWSADVDEPIDPTLLVERFLDGPEFSVECVSEHGEHLVVAVTEKARDTRHFVESGHVLPAPVSTEVSDRIADYVRRCLDALGVRCGPTHSEIILTTDGPVMVETHVRLAGDEIPQLIQDAFGVDLYEVWARQAVGESVLADLRATLAGREPRVAGIRFLTPKAAGTLREVVGLDEARDVTFVTEVSPSKGAGQPVSVEIRGSFDRCGFVRGVAPNAQALSAALDEAAARIRFVVECPGGASP
jgi:hypothetical protein